VTPFHCQLACYGVARATAADTAALRREPAPGVVVPAALLKFADDQAVAAVAAALRAVQASGRPTSDFADWGVAGAPRYFGRLGAARVIERFRVRGAPGVSPLVAPQMSLNALAGAVSLALGCHGPVSSFGGGVDALSDGLVAGLSLLNDAVPGVWVVLTAYDPEPVAADDPAAVCHAVALALAPGAGGLCLERGGGRPTSVAALGRFLENDRADAWPCGLVGGWRVTVTKPAAAAARAA
jgi:hypothetical protein